MKDKNNTGLSDHPIIVYVGLIACLIAIFAFVTGKNTLPEWFGNEESSTHSPTSTATIPPTQLSISDVPPIVCVPHGVENHETSNPRYIRPEGYFSGWITSDPSDVILPDGTFQTISVRYVIIVENLSEVQIRNVAIGSEHSNTWGCWFRSDLNDEVLARATEELEKMKEESPTVATAMYRVSPSGFEKID